MSNSTGRDAYTYHKPPKSELEDAEMRAQMGLDADLRHEKPIDPAFAFIHADYVSHPADRIKDGYGLGDECVLSAARAM